MLIRTWVETTRPLADSAAISGDLTERR